MHFSDEYKVSKYSRSGAKNCIELISVHAAIEEMATKSCLRSFEHFIMCIQKFDDLNIAFGSNGHQCVRPRVMDPVNPYNNLASCWDPDSIKLLKQYARETSKRLQHLESSDNALLDKLFEPQPVYRSDMPEILGFDPMKLKIELGTTPYSLLPDLKVRNEDFHKDYKLRMFMDTIQKYYQSAIHASKASGYDENQITKAVQHTIDKQICNRDEQTWSPAEGKHEESDITFTIPINSTKAIRISHRL